MSDELHHELLIFDRQSARTVGDDWMSFPDSILLDTPTDVAEEILTLLSDEPVSDGLRLWLGHLRGDVVQARAQDSMFKGDL